MKKISKKYLFHLKMKSKKLKKNYAPQPGGIYPRHAQQLQHLKKINPSYQQLKNICVYQMI